MGIGDWDTSCPNNYYEKLSDYSDIFICKTVCYNGQFKYQKEEQFECLFECPEEAKYIYQNNE